MDPVHFLHEHLAQASPDLLRQMPTTFINTLMSAEADAVEVVPSSVELRWRPVVRQAATTS
jgi:hypothetical protein